MGIPSFRQAGYSLIVSLAGVLLLVGCAADNHLQGKYTRADIHIKRGDGFFFNNRFEEALREYTLAVETAPKDSRGYRFRGMTALALGRRAEALTDFDRAIEVGPEDSESWLARGVLHYQAGRFSDAIDDFDRAVEFDPWNGRARYYKALACEKVGRLREAAESYRGYIHCTIPREGAEVEHAWERLRVLEETFPP